MEFIITIKEGLRILFLFLCAITACLLVGGALFYGYCYFFKWIADGFNFNLDIKQTFFVISGFLAHLSVFIFAIYMIGSGKGNAMFLVSFILYIPSLFLSYSLLNDNTITIFENPSIGMFMVMLLALSLELNFLN
jgi:hypothetical protein